MKFFPAVAAIAGTPARAGCGRLLNIESPSITIPNEPKRGDRGSVPLFGGRRHIVLVANALTSCEFASIDCAAANC
jgi:hypothetical protein